MALAHPTSEMLTAYATGAATHGASLLVATHLTFCSGCRALIADLETVSGALLAEAEGVEMDAGALDATLARVDAEPPEAERRPPGEDEPRLPRTVSRALGDRELRWRFRMPGVSEIEIASEGGERISLIRVRPGTSVPAHTHTAVEATVVLAGAMEDRGIVYRPGDVAIADMDDDHRPKAGEDAECVCLVVTMGAMRFTGAFGRALNLFTE